MRSYELIFKDDRDDAVQRLQFEAADSGRALQIVRQVSGTRPMELWEDGKKLCDLHRKPVGTEEVWIVGQQRQTSPMELLTSWSLPIPDPIEGDRPPSDQINPASGLDGSAYLRVAIRPAR